MFKKIRGFFFKIISCINRVEKKYKKLIGEIDKNNNGVPDFVDVLKYTILYNLYMNNYIVIFLRGFLVASVVWAIVLAVVIYKFVF